MTISAIELVGQCTAVEVVVAVQTKNAVAAVVVTTDAVRTRSALGDDTRLDGGFVPADCVAEFDLLNLVAATAFEIVADAELVGRAVTQHQAVANALQRRELG